MAVVLAVRAIGIRELRNRLSRYLDDVRRGEVVLVTDRGEVIAEIRQPTPPQIPRSPLERRIEAHVRQGVIAPASVPKDKKVYERPTFSTPAVEIDALIGAIRGDR